MVTRNNIHRPKFNLQKLGRVRKQALKCNPTSYKSVTSTNIQHVRRISKKKAQQKEKQLQHIMDSALVKAGGVKEAIMKDVPIQKEAVAVKKAIPSGPGTTLGAPSEWLRSPRGMPADSVIPDIPGVPVDPRMENMLRESICQVVGVHGTSYFVAEKSDGVRVLLYCLRHENGQQQVFLEMTKSYGIEMMFREIIPKLKHGNDGLIFTSSVAPYVLSTNTKMLKWKPPSENTVDFKLALQAPILNGVPDYKQKPQFILLEWQGGQQYTPFGQMVVDDALWEQWKSTSTQLQNRVVEVTYSPNDQSWRFFRFRDDKEHGNHSSVVRKVVESIRD
ncbi:Dcp1p-Dcp2p decapping enzyme complex alpha subunit, partial [Lobosporangium transversale]